MRRYESANRDLLNDNPLVDLALDVANDDEAPSDIEDLPSHIAARGGCQGAIDAAKRAVQLWRNYSGASP